jgi:predicted  nucleic acid-binding Zn-ribbon protein
MQSYERPDQRALEELGELLRHLGEELAAWRRRSLKAESDMAELKAKGGVLAGPELIQARQRIIELELENQALRQRVEATRDRVKLLADRMGFLEQDADDGVP